MDVMMDRMKNGPERPVFTSFLAEGASAGFELQDIPRCLDVRLFTYEESPLVILRCLA